MVVGDAFQASIPIDVPEDERPHAPLFPIQRTPPPPQHNHPTRQDDAFVRPTSRIELRVVVDVMIRVVGSAFKRRRDAAVRSDEGVEILHHRNAMPARYLLLGWQRVQDAAAVEGLGVVARAAELAVVDTALGGSGTLGLGRRFVEYVAEIFGGHGVEVRLEDFRPTGSVCLRLEVKFQRLEIVLVIDAVGEEVFLAWFTPTDEVHFVEVMQIGCCKAPLCQL